MEKKINDLRGYSKSQTPYIPHNNRKIYEEKEKERIFMKIWSNIFRTSPEEDQHFNLHNNNMVNTYINDNNV